jgi:Ca-activated chloride channel family protein
MSTQDIDARLSRQPIERYQWPLATGLILLSASMLIGERRRMGAAASPALIFLSLLLWVPGAAAKNNGVEAYERHDYTGALNQFSRQLQRQPHSPALHFNLGDAAYQQGDIDKALGAFSQALTSPDPQIREKAEYNLGNTLFQRGAMQKEREPKVQDWRNALQHYEQALKIEPKNGDAAYNADVVRKLLEEAEKEPPKSDQKKDQQKKDQNKDDKQQQPSPGDKGDQEQKDGQQSADKQGEGKQEQDKAGQGDQNKKKEQGDKSDDQKQQDKDGDKKDGQAGEQPDQNPKQGEKKEGDLKNAPQFGEDKDGQDGDQQEAEARAAAEGKMTEAQARSLLESLKGEDDRVQLLNPKDRKVRGRVLRDW